MVRQTAILILGAALLAGCGDEEPPPAPASPSAPADSARERELRKLKALDAVGHDGDAVRRQLERSIDAVEKRNRQTDEAAGRTASSSGAADAD